MTISIFQASIIGVLAYLGSLSVPWFFGLSGGWYTLSRPLVSGMLIGVILGDVTTGVLVGTAVQVVYIALVTPGATMPQDLNAAAYIGVGLGVIAVKEGATIEAAIAIATAVGAVGTIFHNFMMVTNSFWNHRAVEAINRGDMKALKFNHYIGPQIMQFCYRFIPTTLVVYYGTTLATKIIELFPIDSFIMRTISALGGLLPAVGIAILLTMVIKKNIQLVQFLFGFTLVAALKMNMISVAIMAAFFAYLHFNYMGLNKVSQDEEEVL